MPPATTVSQPVLPADVPAFAAEQGVADYVVPVLEITRRAFPNCAIRPSVEEDAEIPDWRTIVMQVDLTGWDVDRIWTAQQKWTAALFQHCPAIHVHFFVLGMWASA